MYKVCVCVCVRERERETRTLRVYMQCERPLRADRNGTCRVACRGAEPVFRIEIVEEDGIATFGLHAQHIPHVALASRRVFSGVSRRCETAAEESIGIVHFLCLDIRLSGIWENRITAFFDIAEEDEYGGNSLPTTQVRVCGTAIPESKLVFINAVGMCIPFSAAWRLSL